MKFIAVTVAAAVVALGTTVGAGAASAEGTSVARSVPVSPKHFAPRTNNTGGFIFGFPPESAGRNRGYVRGIIGGNFGGGAPGHPGHGHDHDHHDGDNFVGDYAYGYGAYDSDGYVDTIPMTTEPGFFANGGSVSFDGTKPVYDYDRSYPYDHYRGRAGGARYGEDLRGGSHVVLSDAPPAPSRCQVQAVRDGESGRMANVRVCRRG